MTGDVSSKGAIPVDQLLCMHSSEWRDWLVANHDRRSEIWLVFLKGCDSGQSLTYSDALDEALCFGWIDSLIKRIDETRYLRKFSKRRKVSKWSEANRARVEQLFQENRMAVPGVRSVEAAKETGSWYAPDNRPVLGNDVPVELEAALEKNPEAKAYFDGLTLGHKKQYIWWIASAKRQETIQKRVKEAITLLNKKKTLGLR